MKIGIVGLPHVGKSTLFRALTKKQVDIANYPFVTIEPNIGVVEVPDERVDKLTELSRSKKKIHAVVEFVDIAGLVKGAAEGEGLGNKFLSHIREVDALAEVVRIFEDPNVIHVSGGADPVSDMRVIELELALKDLEIITKRLQSIEKQVKAGDPAVSGTARIQKEILGRLKETLEAGKRAGEIAGSDQRDEAIMLFGELGLLTAKPRIIVCNASEEQIQNRWQPEAKLTEEIKNDPWLALSAKVEDELNSLSPSERAEYLASLGMASSGLDQLIETGYRTLGLITFLTTGEDETRAWTIRAGSTAPQAGRAIHSDFEEKFIRADVVVYERLVEAGSWAHARELGWLRTEGREYVVRDGDVIEFRI